MRYSLPEGMKLNKKHNSEVKVMTNFYTCGNAGVLLQVDEMANPCADGIQLVRPVPGEPGDAKHTPHISKIDGGIRVKMGNGEHPMTEEHRIMWVCVKTSFGGSFCRLFEGDAPEALFFLNPDEVEEVYAWCNVHGLFAAKTPIFEVDFELNDVACSMEFTAGCMDNGL